MSAKINPNLNSNADFARLNGENTFQPKPLLNTNAQNSAAFVRLNDSLTDTKPEKTPLQSLKESLAKKPIDENLKDKSETLIVNPKKPSSKMKTADYEQAVWRSVFGKADYGMLSDGQISQAVSLIKSADSSITSSGLDLANMRKADELPGVLTVTTDRYTIELAKRTGEIVFKNGQNTGRKSLQSKRSEPQRSQPDGSRPRQSNLEFGGQHGGRHDQHGVGRGIGKRQRDYHAAD